ncbi:plasmid related protein [Rhodopirellula sallentina SM41]|uniref:Plasmid related protein n=2 Tax=Rhodopirellula TaxID=265488 RepID=M5U8H0_9BACT|nr:plasmid related protein [Rhodopirellula sallentina SM41]
MVAMNDRKPRFALGQVVATPGALDALETAKQTPIEFIQRHVVLDQGELDEEDQQTNLEAVANSERVLSSYLLSDGTKIWIITEADRSSTCLLLPEEY